MGRRAQPAGTPTVRGYRQLTTSLPDALDAALREHGRRREEPLNTIAIAALTEYLRRHGNAVVRAMLDGVL